MNFEKTVVLLALVWLVGSFSVMAVLIHRGRRLVARFAREHPDAYESMGRPCPGYLESAQKRRFAQFLALREYSKIGDSDLAEAFENFRRSENRALAFLLSTLGMVALLAVIMGANGG